MVNTKIARRSRLAAEKHLSHVLHIRGMRGRFSRKRRRSRRALTGTAKAVKNRINPRNWSSQVIQTEDSVGCSTSDVTHGFVRLPPRVTETLVKWKRVLVNTNDESVFPLDRRLSLASCFTCHESDANIVVKKEASDNVRLTSTEKVIKDESEEMPTSPCVEAVTGSVPTRLRNKVKQQRMVTPEQGCGSNAIGKGSAVYAVYFRTYYPAVVISVNGILGYEVRFITDNVVKSVPLEAVLPLTSLRVGHKCLVNDFPEGSIYVAKIVALPEVVEDGSITVSLVNEKRRVSRTFEVRWHDLSFPVGFWRNEIKWRTQLKVNVVTDHPCSDKADEQELETSSRNYMISKSLSRSCKHDTFSRAATLSYDEAEDQMEIAPDISNNVNSSEIHGTSATRKATSEMKRCLHYRDPALYTPLWASFRGPKEERATTAQRTSWPLPVHVSAFLKMRPADRWRDRSFLVTLEGRRWHCQYKVMNSQLGSQEEANAFEVRERLVENMRSVMERRCPDAFLKQYPRHHHRLNFQKEWRVALRITETRINRRLRSFGIAPIYIESWTRRQPSFLNFDYLPRSTISVRLQREVFAEGVRLRHMYPERTRGCECPRQKCVVGECPCLVYKKNNSVMMCGQACGCDDSCPSTYLREERQVPLVLFNTKAKGWGVIAPVRIPAGTFLGLYAGHMVTSDDQTLYDNTYVFDINGEELVFCYSKEVMQQRTFGIPCR
ncbi:hypothetical protein V3C99_004318 [Haemonchus contortus]